MSSTAGTDFGIHIYWPGGGSTVWKTGQAIVNEDGVTPLDAKTLGAVAGLLTGAGVLLPLDDERTHFLSTVPRDVLPENLRTVLPSLDAMGRGEVEGSGDRV